MLMNLLGSNWILKGKMTSLPIAVLRLGIAARNLCVTSSAFQAKASCWQLLTALQWCEGEANRTLLPLFRVLDPS